VAINWQQGTSITENEERNYQSSWELTTKTDNGLPLLKVIAICKSNAQPDASQKNLTENQLGNAVVTIYLALRCLMAFASVS